LNLYAGFYVISLVFKRSDTAWIAMINIKHRALLTLIFFSLIFFGFSGKPPKKGKINWLTLEEAAIRTKTEPRKIVVDVYTDWCGWCRKMDQSTFTDPEIADYINKNFYAVKLDAEGKDPITINGKKYKYNPQYRSHEAAISLLNGQMSYPSTVYLDEKMAIISPVPGYLDAANFKKILIYFGDNHYKKKSFQEYTAAAVK
jgi:thioredoxin-related protein